MNTIFQGHVLLQFGRLLDQSVNCIVTSPPYFGLRDYGTEPVEWPEFTYRFFGVDITVPSMTCSLGLESTPQQFIGHLVLVFREARRVLRDDGTLWLNMGDSYASQAGGYDETGSRGKNAVISKNTQAAVLSGKQRKPSAGLKPKDLIGIPWMLAFALREDGWYLRQDIIWHKPNPMPESVTDRCTKSHEYIFLLSKSQKYYYDQKAIMVEGKDPEDDYRRLMGSKDGDKSNPDAMKNGLRPRDNWNGSSFDTGKTGEMKSTHGHTRRSGNKERKPAAARGVPVEDNGSTNGAVAASVPWEGFKANKRSVWTVTTKPFKEAHFATFPEELIVDMIKAGCPIDGTVLDPFFGAGTTGLVARKLQRNYIGIELNPKYIAIAERRLRSSLGLFI